VAFCHELGLNYVSCSPYRVAIARLAAAQAAVAVLEGEETQRQLRATPRNTSKPRTVASKSGPSNTAKKASSKKTSVKKVTPKKVVAKKKSATKQAAKKNPVTKTTGTKHTAKKIASPSRTRKKPTGASKRR